MQAAAVKFDPARAAEYEQQSRIALAGYEACHELVACMLATAIGPGKAARVLVAGAGGTAQEIITIGTLEPQWSFTGVDPSAPMLELSRSRIDERGFTERVDLRLGYVDDLPAGPAFDAATLIGVLHHLPGLCPLIRISQIPTGLRPPSAWPQPCRWGAPKRSAPGDRPPSSRAASRA